MNVFLVLELRRCIGSVALALGLSALLLVGVATGSQAAGPPDAAVSAVAADSVKRVRFADLTARERQNPTKLATLHFVRPFVEVKTLWHPVSP